MLTLMRAKLHSDLTGAGRLTSPAALLSAHSCPSVVVPGVHSRRGGRQTAGCPNRSSDPMYKTGQQAHRRQAGHTVAVCQECCREGQHMRSKAHMHRCTDRSGRAVSFRTIGQQGPHCPVHGVVLWLPPMPLPRGAPGGRSPVHPLAAQSPGQSLPWDWTPPRRAQASAAGANQLSASAR